MQGDEEAEYRRDEQLKITQATKFSQAAKIQLAAMALPSATPAK